MGIHAQLQLCLSRDGVHICWLFIFPAFEAYGYVALDYSIIYSSQGVHSKFEMSKIRPGLGPVKYLQVSPDIGSREMVCYAAGCSTCSEVSCSTANLSWLESV